MKTTQPYLLMIAWTREGSARAQFEEREIIRDGDEIVAERAVLAAGVPLPLAEEILGSVNAGLLGRIEQMQAEHAAEVQSLRDALAAAQAAPAAPVAGPDLAALDEAFETLVPEELRATFEPAWVTVRGLMQAGKIARAAAFVRSLPVSDDLAPVREQIATMIDGGQ